MSWKNILKKIISPIDFMEEIADKLNGKMDRMKSTRPRHARKKYIVRYGDKNRIELRHAGGGNYNIRIFTDGTYPTHTHNNNLSNIKMWINSKLDLGLE